METQALSVETPQSIETDYGLWWLSFADPHKPKGEQFLGVAIVQAASMKLAVSRTWELQINPGGEVIGVPIIRKNVKPDKYLLVMEPALHNKLLSLLDLQNANLL